MNKPRLLTIIILACSALCAEAKGVVISGSAPDYAGEPLELYCIEDGICRSRRVLARDTVSPDGSFSLSFDASETLLCRLDLGAYEGLAFASPGRSYNVNLPPRKEPTRGEQLSPFFSPEEVVLSLNDPQSGDLNLLISGFEDCLDSLWNEVLFKSLSLSGFASRYSALEKRYEGINDDFFYDYRAYSYALLLNLYGERGRDLAIGSFMLGQKPRYSNPAYWEAFGSLMEGFEDRRRLSSNRELFELKIISDVADGRLDPAYLDLIRTERPRKIAACLAQTKFKTRKELPVGVPGLVNIGGDSLRWKDFREPFIYVCFTSSDLRESGEDLDFASGLKDARRESFAFVFVFAGEERAKTAATVKNYGQKEYICNLGDNPGAAAAFGLTRPPEYFILTNEGTFEVSPAPAPQLVNP